MSPSENGSSSRVSGTIGYLTMLAVGVGGFFLVRHLGADAAAPPPTSPEGFGSGDAGLRLDALMHVFIALAVIIVMARLMGSAFALLKQPPVIGEVIAGLMLGPSLLGRVAPELSAFVLPAQVAPFLGILSQVGVVLYMFLVGVELDFSLIKTRTHATVVISHASIIVPFLLGSSLALLLYGRLSSSDVPFTVFAMFLGVSMSVTAFPVLARILTDRGIQKTRLGTIALTCAAVDDVSAWCLLALVVSIAKTETHAALWTLLLSLSYVAAMILVVRPVLARLVGFQEKRGPLTRTALSAIFVMLLASAGITESIGIHGIFGAFALGAIIPHDSTLARELKAKLEDIVLVLLLPAFFAYTGLRTQVGLVSGASEWLLCILIIVVASLGKFGGSLAAARLSGMGWRESASLGILLNTRGLVELIVLNIGLDLRVISPRLFAMLVIMALVTTMATTPVLHLLSRPASPRLSDSPPESTPPPRVESSLPAHPTPSRPPG
jgi:Kef-type K+ transport system membrane component KefB